MNCNNNNKNVQNDKDQHTLPVPPPPLGSVAERRRLMRRMALGSVLVVTDVEVKEPDRLVPNQSCVVFITAWKMMLGNEKKMHNYII